MPPKMPSGGDAGMVGFNAEFGIKGRVAPIKGIPSSGSPIRVVYGSERSGRAVNAHVCAADSRRGVGNSRDF